MRYFFLPLLFLAFVTLNAQPGADLHLEAQTYTAQNGTEIKAESGYLTVSENRDNPAAADIDVRFVRLKSTAKNPGTPLVYLEGGPGSSSSWMINQPWALNQWVPLLELGDVILLDQRGTGTASQRLTYINMAPLPQDVLTTEEALTDHFRSMVQPAKKAWAAAGIDYHGYTTLENARDIEALRQALGVEKISLLGFSYGTQLGQAYLKYFSGHVDKTILIGVEGLAETFKLPLRMDDHFRRISAFVAADDAVNKDVPDLVALYQRVANKLSATPVTLTLKSPLNGQPMDLPVGKVCLDYILSRDLGDASDLPVIPRLLYTMDQGDYSVFQWFVQKRIGGLYGMHAMAMIMDMASGVSPARRAMIAEQEQQSMFGGILNPVYLQTQELFNAPDLGPEFRSSYTVSSPVLLLSGTLDMNTPPFQAERLRWNLPNATHLVVENAGHEQIIRHPEIQKAIYRFLKGENVGDVKAGYPGLKFIPVRGEQDEHPAG